MRFIIGIFQNWRHTSPAVVCLCCSLCCLHFKVQGAVYLSSRGYGLLDFCVCILCVCMCFCIACPNFTYGCSCKASCLILLFNTNCLNHVKCKVFIININYRKTYTKCSVVVNVGAIMESWSFLHVKGI